MTLDPPTILALTVALAAAAALYLLIEWRSVREPSLLCWSAGFATITVGSTLALLLMDIDSFKAYNDHFGHQQGYLAAGHASQLIKPVGVEPKAKLAGGVLPGGQVQGHGVHQSAVEVENQALKSG